MLRPAQQPRGPLRVPASAWTWIGVIAAALALAFAGRLGRWIGVGLILAVAPRLFEPVLRLPWIADRRATLARMLPWAVLATITLALLGELVLGHPPASRDHGIHYFQTKVFVDELLPRGELVGWSDSLNTGYPFGDSYPVLGYFFTGFAHLISFGAISLRTSYAWGLLAVWLIALGGVAWLAKTIAHEIRLARDDGETAPDDLLDPAWAGAFAAIAWLIDPGASREGGWNYLMFHGVWPQLLSSGLWIASLPATWHALRRPSLRSLALAGLLLGASVLAHPFGMLTAATSLVAWPVVLWASGSFSRLPPGALRWGTIIHVLAGVVAAGGVVTFLSSADSMARSPVPWKSLGELASELISGELFVGHRAWIGPLALIGLVVALRRGRGLAWLALVLVVGLLVLGSDASITVLRLDLIVSGFKNLQFPRYAIGLKPVLFTFAGIGAALVLQRLISLPARDEPRDAATVRLPPRPAAARLLACLLLAPIVVGVFDDRGRLLPNPVGAVSPLEGSIHDQAEQALLAALREQAELLDEGQPLTVAFLRRGMGGGTYPLFAITDAGAELVLDGHIPAVNYKYQVRKRGPEALRLIGVTHVLHDRPLTLTGDDRRLGAQLEPVATLGPWTLGRLRPGESESSLVVTGEIAVDDVIVEHPSHREWIVRVERGGEGTVQLPLGPYRKWAIERDGVEIEAKPVALVKGIPGLELPFAGPGEVRLTYVTPKRERIAGWLTVIGVALALVGLAFGKQLHLVERLLGDRTRRLLWACALVGLALIVVLGVRKQQRQLAKTWDQVLRDHRKSKQVELIRANELPLAKQTFVRDLVDAEAWKVSRFNPDGCDGLLGKDAMAGCTQERSRSRLAMAYRAPYLYRCLRVEVQANGWMAIELELGEDEDLAGFVTREGRSVKGLEWRLPGREEFETPLLDGPRQHFHATADGRAGESTIELRNGGDHPQVLCFALAASR
ncbi:hypothetical protein ACNOYE_15125 [Nannocystaceae bacterium ST9]